MSTQIIPITLYGQGGPNPPKVAIILEELGLPYDVIPIAISDVKKPDYVALNPNGRLPTIKDPNMGLTLWESGAIIEYLIERYDTKQKLSFPPGTPEAFLAKQWLFFQATGQAPYYGQLAWFKRYHPEQVPSAIERYTKELQRVSGVLDGHLGRQKEEYGGGDGPWLVGNKLSYADFSFVPWQRMVSMVLPKEEFDEDAYPHVKEWMGKMTSRPLVEKVFAKAQH